MKKRLFRGESELKSTNRLMLQQWVPRIPPGRVEEGEEERKAPRRQTSSRTCPRARRSPARRCRSRRPLSSNSNSNTRRRRPWAAATSSWCFLSLTPHNTRIWSWTGSRKVSDKISRCAFWSNANWISQVLTWLTKKEENLSAGIQWKRPLRPPPACKRHELHACTRYRTTPRYVISSTARIDAYDYAWYT